MSGVVNNNKVDAVVLCHSRAPNGEELITMEVNFHRFILSELNTHRCLSRNYSSSRAVPVEKMIEQVRNDPAIPIHWGKNQRGMVAEEELDNKVVSVLWKEAAINAAIKAENMMYEGCHKQVVNRLLEPFIWTKGVITATRVGWDSVFKLRCHKDSQPEFQALAYKIREAIEASTPNKLYYGDYHLPYIKSHSSKSGNVVEEAIKISTSCCGQVSYRTLDDSLEKALRIYNLLNLPDAGVYKEDPPHFSPTEHVAQIVNPESFELMDYTATEVGGNFNSYIFWQYRKALEQGKEQQFYN